VVVCEGTECDGAVSVAVALAGALEPVMFSAGTGEGPEVECGAESGEDGGEEAGGGAGACS